MLQVDFVVVIKSGFSGLNVEIKASFVDGCVGCHWNHSK